MDNPFGRAILYTYNSAGRLISCMDKGGTVHVMNYDNTGNPKGAVPLADAVVPVPPAANTVRRFVHTFEFRLSGSEEAKQSIPLPHLLVSDCLMAATRAVRMSVTRSPDRATTSIGGVEVHAEVRGKQVVCVARVTDFAVEDLVVVQADVIAYSEQVLPRERKKGDAPLFQPHSNNELRPLFLATPLTIGRLAMWATRLPVALWVLLAAGELILLPGPAPERNTGVGKRVAVDTIMEYQRLGAVYRALIADQFGDVSVSSINESQVPLLPVFRFHLISNGKFPKLPSASVPFGLDLGATQTTDVALGGSKRGQRTFRSKSLCV